MVRPHWLVIVSEILVIMCHFYIIDFSVPVVEETCHYNSTSDLVTHNISWYMKGTQSGVTYRINDIGNWLWYISGGCNYSNGTSIGKVVDY